MDEKHTLVIYTILCIIMCVAYIIYGILHWKEDNTALYTGIGFICGVLGKLIQIKIEDNK